LRVSRRDGGDLLEVCRRALDEGQVASPPPAAFERWTSAAVDDRLTELYSRLEARMTES
jgi:hypothetical protein